MQNGGNNSRYGKLAAIGCSISLCSPCSQRGCEVSLTVDVCVLANLQVLEAAGMETVLQEARDALQHLTGSCSWCTVWALQGTSSVLDACKDCCQ
jgi:hypothetical protein